MRCGSQVILCSYMCVDAGMIAYRNDLFAPCAPFDPVNAPVAKLLWLFLISKVRGARVILVAVNALASERATHICRMYSNAVW